MVNRASYADELYDELVDEFELVDDPKVSIAYRPQEKQEKLLWAMGMDDWFNGVGPVRPAVADNIGYGGAAYGGKSYGLLGAAAIAANAIPGVQMVFFRRSYAEMEGADSIVSNAYKVFPAAGGKARKGGMTWVWPNGSAFYFKHCQYDNDVYSYQGQGFDILFMDEATHFTWVQADYLLTRKRATCAAMEGLRPMAVWATNPGNVGHMWYMKAFGLDRPDWIEHWESREEGEMIANLNGKEELTYFIPAFLEDNDIGTERDPEYEERLRKRDDDTYHALRWGMWDRFTGQAFREWDPKVHVIQPFIIPPEWPRWGGHDWGYDAKYHHLWAARNPDTGEIFVYRELHGRNVTTTNQAKAIKWNTPPGEYIQIRYGGKDMWVKRNVKNIVKTPAQEFWEERVPVFPADTDRVNGAQKIHGALRMLPNGKPGLQIFDNCTMLIRVIPNLVKSSKNPEDIEEMVGDDPYDCLRYLLTNVDAHLAPVDVKEIENNQTRDEWADLGGIL